MLAIYAEASIYGGAEVLIIRFSEFLRNNSVPFILITRKGTRISEVLSWANQTDRQNICAYKDKITHVFVPNIPGLRCDINLQSFSAETKILSMVLHPTEMYTSFFPCTERLFELFGYSSSVWIKRIFFWHKTHILRLLTKLVNNDGLVTMDGATTRGMNYFYPEIASEYSIIPIPAVAKYESKSKNIQPSRLSIGYLGRMDEIKFSAVRPFITSTLKSLTKYRKVEFHFVGEGGLVNALKKACEETGIIFIDYGFQLNEEAKKILRSKTDLTVCMGTAALDMGGIGHPCIIIDPAHFAKTKPQKLFRFVHEIEEYCIGEFRDFSGYVEGLHTFAEIVDILEKDSDIGICAYRYVNSKHNPNIVFQILLKRILDSRACATEVAPLTVAVSKSYHAIDFRVRSCLNWLRRPVSVLRKTSFWKFYE